MLIIKKTSLKDQGWRQFYYKVPCFYQLWSFMVNQSKKIWKTMIQIFVYNFKLHDWTKANVTSFTKNHKSLNIMWFMKMKISTMNQWVVCFFQVHYHLKDLMSELQQTNLEKTLLAWCRQNTQVVFKLGILIRTNQT